MKITALSLLLNSLVLHDFIPNRSLILPLDFDFILCLSLFELPVDFFITAEFNTLDIFRSILVSDYLFEDFAIKLKVTLVQVFIELLFGIFSIQQSVLIVVTRITSDINYTPRLIIILSLNILLVVTL